MAVQSQVKKHYGLDRETMLKIYRLMYLSRRLDDKEIQLKGQNKIFFQISGAGHEAVLVAAGNAIGTRCSCVYAYYPARGGSRQAGTWSHQPTVCALNGAAGSPSHLPTHYCHSAA